MGTAAAVGLGAVVVAGAAAGKALYDVGETFDNAYDRIRVGTGATGKALGRLKSDFQATFATVPADAETVSTAITKLNQRLGLTGRPLQRMSAQMIELSRITETDLTTNIETVTRAFGDFGIKAQKQPEYLDRLFRASQKTGVSVDKLADTMVQFGSPLRSLGFDFDEAAAMVGKFEKEGVNTRLVMGGLRIALGRMAAEGITDASKGFSDLYEQIRNAKNPTEATAIAIEGFGQKAGPDMARAIVEGRLSFEQLVDQIKNGKNSIMLTAEQTRDFNESWTLFKNQVLVVIAPLATKLFNAVGGAMASLTKEMSGVTSKGSDLREFFKGLGTVLGAVFKGMVFGIKATIFIVKVFIKFFRAMGTALRVSWITAINAVKTAFTNATKFLSQLPSKFLNLGKKIATGLVNGVVNTVKSLPGRIRDAFSAAGRILGSIGRSIADWINANTIFGDSVKVGPVTLRIPALAQGTSNFQGGMALVGEQGPELVNLPRGSKVFTASQTRQIAASGIGSAGAPEVRVFIGDRELTDIVRVEMREKDRAARANYRTGVV
jgi:TP901 family phage tail tape measure protein